MLIMSVRRILMFFLLEVLFIPMSAGQGVGGTVRLMWWNLENFFDPVNDSLKNDDDFTAEGVNKWGYKRFEKKKNNIYKTIISMGVDNLPVVIGVCEVENDWVLRQLCFNTPLRKFKYDFIHYCYYDSKCSSLLYRLLL